MKFQRIQDLRTDADMSQRELSEILHISQRSYSHYETGSRNIPIEMLIRLANLWDVHITKKWQNKILMQEEGLYFQSIPPAF